MFALLAIARSRLLLRNSPRAQVETQLRISVAKFKECGYPNALINRIADTAEARQRIHAREQTS
eukprot:4554611-Lingulodinium_polyedra.AAC.1